MSSAPTPELNRSKFKLPFHQELQTAYSKRKKEQEEECGGKGSLLTPPPLQAADAQKVQRSYATFTKNAKGLFTLVNKTISLMKETEACLLQASKELKTLYESGESVLAQDVERLFNALDDDDKNGVALMEDFELEWNNAEEWFRRSTKSLKGAKAEELAYFMEQRFDGLDKAVLTFLLFAQKSLGPKALGERERINSSLDGVMRISELCPTAMDAGASATAGTTAEGILAQHIPAYYMRMYLATLLTEENVDFCTSVQVLESMHTRDPAAPDTRRKAREIVERYISDESESQINISDALKKRVLEAAKAEPVALGAFKDAYAEILRLMHTANSPALFKQTPYYAKLIRRLTPRPYSPTFSLAESKASFYAALPRPLEEAEAAAAKKGKKSQKKAAAVPAAPAKSVVIGGDGSLVAMDSGAGDVQMQSPRRPETRRKRRETIRKTLRQQSSHSFVTLRKKDIPNGRYITIADVLRNKPLYKDFKNFLREKGDEKPLQFVKEVSAFAKKHFPSQLEIRADATQIFERYLVFSDIEPSIGTSFETQQDLYTKIYESPDKPLRNDMFARASKEVVEVMKLTVFIQYLISERWLPIKWTPYEESKSRKGSGHKPHSLSNSSPLIHPHVPSDSSPAPLISQQRALSKQSTESSKLSSQSKVVLEKQKQQQHGEEEDVHGQIEQQQHEEEEDEVLPVPQMPAPPPPPPQKEAPPPPVEIASPPPPQRVTRRHTRNASETLALNINGRTMMISSSGSRGDSSPRKVVKAPRGFSQEAPVMSPAEQMETLPPPPPPPPPAAEDADGDAERNACLELLDNYRHVFLPKYEGLVKELGRLKVFEDLAAQRNNVYTIQTIAQCVDAIELPQGVVAPQFTVVNDNPKFVQFRKKLLKCTWETSQKVSFIVRDLATNKDNVAGLAVKLADYTDMYNNMLLAFSTTQ